MSYPCYCLPGPARCDDPYAWCDRATNGEPVITTDEIERATQARARMEADAGYHHEKWRRLIKEAKEQGMAPEKIAEAAGISRVRLYQILKAMR